MRECRGQRTCRTKPGRRVHTDTSWKGHACQGGSWQETAVTKKKQRSFGWECSLHLLQEAIWQCIWRLRI